MPVNVGEKMKVAVDGVETAEGMIILVDDGAEHSVTVAANKII
jgi:predicted RecB family endonuclease